MACKTDNPSIGAICEDCAVIFRGQQEVGMKGEHEFRSSISLTRPEKCRICLLIWSRHSRHIEEASSRGRTLEPPNLSYILVDIISSGRRVVNARAVELRLKLHYGDGDTLQILLAMLSPESDHDPQAAEVLSSNTNSEESCEFIKSKLGVCLDSHQACRARAEYGDLLWRPTRLLRIDNMTEMIYLQEGMDIERIPYATLSHCWGDSKPTKLTAKTEHSLRTGIPIESLPKTFKDAISIAKRLSIQYLWVDSLCIFQDDLDDWHAEATAMCDVYSHGFLNIAATAAPDSSAGLFFERDNVAECAFNIHTTWDLKSRKNETYPTGIYRVFPADHWTNNVEEGALNKRAWVMQERFLSPRVVHFSASQIFWECLENTSAELFPNAMHPTTQPSWFNDSQNPLKNALFRSQQGENWNDEIYEGWKPFVKSFTRCELTKESDRPIAIQGIQELLTRLTGDKFIYGLSSNNLFQELCWTRHPSFAQPAKYHLMSGRAPSWSWAGSNVHIHPGQLRHHTRCSNFKYVVEYERVESEQHSHGDLQAPLILRGKLFHPTSIVRTGEADYGDTLQVSTETSSTTSSTDDFDVVMDDESSHFDQMENLTYLAIWRCQCVMNLDPPPVKPILHNLGGLVLESVDVDQKRYRRVGVYNVGEFSYGLHGVEESFYDFYSSNESEITTVSII